MPITRRGWFGSRIRHLEETSAGRPTDLTITRRGRGTVTRRSPILRSVEGFGEGGESDKAVDATRRTHLANERTYLAWWRTGVTALAASVAVVPSLTHQARWPYAVVGAGFALMGIVAIGYGFQRQREVREALRIGEFPEPSQRVLFALTLSGVVLACLLLVIVLADL
jgi:putative membrane protein